MTVQSRLTGISRKSAALPNHLPSLRPRGPIDQAVGSVDRCPASNMSSYCRDRQTGSRCVPPQQGIMPHSSSAKPSWCCTVHDNAIVARHRQFQSRVHTIAGHNTRWASPMSASLLQTSWPARTSRGNRRPLPAGQVGQKRRPRAEIRRSCRADHEQTKLVGS